MSLHADWPDIVIVVVLLAATLKGFFRGLLAELGGIAAIIAALVVPFYYNGLLDAFFEAQFNMGAGPAHVTGMVVSAIIVYALALILLWLLERTARFPGLGTGNAVGGAIIGFAKGAVLLWATLFVALLFPLSSETRAQLRSSYLVPILLQQTERFDDAIYAKLPEFLQPLVRPIFDRQRTI